MKKKSFSKRQKKASRWLCENRKNNSTFPNTIMLMIKAEKHAKRMRGEK